MADFPHSAMWRNAEAHHRFALASLVDEGVLLDLHRGAFYRINLAAARICREWLEGKAPEAIARELARSYSISESQALHDVDSVFARVFCEREVRSVNPIAFTREAQKLRMEWNGQPLCWLDPAAERLDLCSAPCEPLGVEIAALLLWAAPHLLALYSQDVLHASAVALPEGVLAFCGPSGAGKTTLAQLATDQGASLVSEDLVLVAWSPEPHAVADGESALRGWVAEQSPVLATQGWIRTAGILEATCGARVPLRAVHFLDGARSSQPAIERTPLSPAAALVELLRNGFAELAQPAIWRQLLKGSERLVHAVEMFHLRCPEGLDVLRNALEGYSWITKS